jgi:hypothetical protein
VTRTLDLKSRPPRKAPKHTPVIEQSQPATHTVKRGIPKGNRQMRRVLNQAANAAVKAKGTIFSVVYRRIVPRLGHAQAIGAITHRLCRLIWKILHERVRYEERGPAVSVEARKVRARKMIRELRGLGIASSSSYPFRRSERFSTLADPWDSVNRPSFGGSPGFSS